MDCERAQLTVAIEDLLGDGCAAAEGERLRLTAVGRAQIPALTKAMGEEPPT